MTVAKFSHTTRSAFKTQFFNRIGAEVDTFWTDDEVNLLIDESLYTFGGIAQSWKDDVIVDLTTARTFYDLTENIFINSDLLELSLTYQHILDQINFHLIEEISVGSPTSQITNLAEILKFARNRVNQYQLLTGLVLSRSTIDLDSPPINKVTVGDEFIDILRVAYFEKADAVPVYSKLREEDEQSLSYEYRNSFSTNIRFPKYYATILGDLNQISIYPPPLNLGALEIISVNGIPSTTVIDLATVIRIPNNLVHYIKWGVLVDIYSKDGIGNNLAMAQICAERWNEGIVIGQNYTSVLMAYINGIPISIDTLSNIDDENYNWENNRGKPFVIGLAGYNILAPNRRTASEVYSLKLSTVTNAYVPLSDDDFIDIKPEYIKPLLDYCIYLANAKNGAEALKEVDELKNGFLKMAVNYNLRLINRGISYEKMMKQVKNQQIDEPTLVKEAA